MSTKALDDPILTSHLSTLVDQLDADFKSYFLVSSRLELHDEQKRYLERIINSNELDISSKINIVQGLIALQKKAYEYGFESISYVYRSEKTPTEEEINRYIKKVEGYIELKEKNKNRILSIVNEILENNIDINHNTNLYKAIRELIKKLLSSDDKSIALIMIEGRLEGKSIEEARDVIIQNLTNVIYILYSTIYSNPDADFNLSEVTHFINEIILRNRSLDFTNPSLDYKYVLSILLNYLGLSSLNFEDSDFIVNLTKILNSSRLNTEIFTVDNLYPISNSRKSMGLITKEG